jgi:hypothetical protein
MSAREDWAAGEPRPVMFAVKFDDHAAAVAFHDEFGSIDVDELTCDHCGEPLWRVFPMVETTRAHLHGAADDMRAEASRAGGELSDSALVLFDEPDYKAVDLRRPRRRLWKGARR